MTDFLAKTRCDRCGTRLTARIMSRFNEDCLCMGCEQEERKHPDYAKAAEAELTAIRAGDYNYPGIGWPGKDGRLP